MPLTSENFGVVDEAAWQDGQVGAPSPPGSGPQKAKSRVVLLSVVGAVLFGVIFVVAALAWKGGYLSRGVEKQHLTYSNGFSTHVGMSFGAKSFYATSGKTITVNYDATVARGHLKIWIRPSGLAVGSVVAQTPDLKSASGTLTYQVPQSGMYEISIFPVPDGTGYDVSYDVKWSVR